MAMTTEIYIYVTGQCDCVQLSIIAYYGNDD